MAAWAALGLAFWLAACSRSLEPITSCEAQGPARPLCGYQNPEDLVALPGGRTLLVSEYGGGMDSHDPGWLSRLDLASEERTVLFRAGDGSFADGTWGDPNCPGAPETFSPHGIDLVRREDGRLALFVVNHGGRESVEFFEVHDVPGEVRVTWRGCAVAGEGAWLNDVAARPDGGFFVTNMVPRRGFVGQAIEFAKASLLQVASGHVKRWMPGEGFSHVAGSESVFPNGIALSPDGSTLFINSTLGGSVRGVELASGRTLGEAIVESPDNSSWAPDGRLWVASITAPTPEVKACGNLEHGACPASFQIIAVHPKSYATEVIYSGDGATMGAGTVGVSAGGDLFVGSFSGDRILRVTLGGD